VECAFERILQVNCAAEMCIPIEGRIPQMNCAAGMCIPIEGRIPQVNCAVGMCIPIEDLIPHVNCAAGMCIPIEGRIPQVNCAVHHPQECHQFVQGGHWSMVSVAQITALAAQQALVSKGCAKRKSRHWQQCMDHIAIKSRVLVSPSTSLLKCSLTLKLPGSYMKK
jgi:hypothetical protein